ncbi:MAG TPA: hypothetical protein VF586_00485 [Pyrinomonadaceae bacterium]|jgi:hypothetical protein
MTYPVRPNIVMHPTGDTKDFINLYRAGGRVTQGAGLLSRVGVIAGQSGSILSRVRALPAGSPDS